MADSRIYPIKKEVASLRSEIVQAFEAKDRYGFLRYLEHGVPSPLVRWHYHHEYELHLILETKGKVFVGDYIGNFEPGHLVLTGAGLPHNWVSEDIDPHSPVILRDRVLQFDHEPLEVASGIFPELKGLIHFLERARYGVEFFGMSDIVNQHLLAIKAYEGVDRFAEFMKLCATLIQSTDYRLLSTLPIQVNDNHPSMHQMNKIISHISENYTQTFSMAEICAELGMSESQFSRFFRKATGNYFTEFINRLRINKACQLLMETHLYITDICYAVGFNNVANFNRRFLEFKGVTPTTFRAHAEARFGQKK